jgi:hypothetical protein
MLSITYGLTTFLLLPKTYPNQKRASPSKNVSALVRHISPEDLKDAHPVQAGWLMAISIVCVGTPRV